MATQKLKGARELLDLDVREVSLVDRPANLREFLIVKRIEGDDPMGVYESDYSNGGVDPSQVSPVLVTKQTDNGSGDPAVEVVKQTTDGGVPVDVETIAKAIEGETVDMTKGRHAYEVAAQKSGAREEAEEAMTKRQEAELEKAEEVAKAKAKADADKAKHPDDKDGKGKGKPFGKTETTTKSVDGEGGGDPAADNGDGDDQMVVVKRDGTVHVNGELVEKSQSATNLRKAAVSGAVTALAKLLGDLSDEDLAKALEGIAKGEMPKNPGYTSGTRPMGTKGSKLNPVPMKKNEDGGEENPVVTALQEALAPITKRLDDIEKTRTPSTSIDGDGGSDNKETVTKSFWDGIL